MWNTKILHCRFRKSSKNTAKKFIKWRKFSQNKMPKKTEVTWPNRKKTQTSRWGGFYCTFFLNFETSVNLSSFTRLVFSSHFIRVIFNSEESFNAKESGVNSLTFIFVLLKGSSFDVDSDVSRRLVASFILLELHLIRK